MALNGTIQPANFTCAVSNNQSSAISTPNQCSGQTRRYTFSRESHAASRSIQRQAQPKLAKVELRADIAQVRADTTAMRKTLSDHSHKLSALTGQVVQLRSAGGGDAAMAAMISGRVDTIEDRLTRIEEKIGLTDP